MATVDQLIIEIKAETTKLRKGLDQVNRSLDVTQKKSMTVTSSFRGLGKAFALIGGGLAIKGIVNTARSFEDLEATLRAVTGSAPNAKLAMQTVTEFTKTTPFQLKNVTESFIRFFQAGIEPNAENLKAFGNLAAGMGKDITQLAQATFNATTGEMEMLKQFGIKAKLMGDEIEVSFEGQKTTIDRTGEAIGEFLLNLGRTRFPTAIEERLNTLSGATSNLQDQLSLASDSIGKAGLNEALTNLAKTLSDGVAGTTDFTEGLGKLAGHLVDIVTFALQAASKLGFFIDLLVTGSQDVLDRLRLALTGFQLFIIESFNSIVEPIQNSVNLAIEALNKLPFNDDIEPIDLTLDTESFNTRIDELIESIKSRRPQIPVEPTIETEGTQEGSITPPKGDSTTDELDGLTAAFAELQPVITEATNKFTNDFVESLMNGENAMKSFKDLFKDMARQIIASALQMQIIKPIMDAMFTAVGLPVGAKAGGGRVQKGMPTLVGERGAEIFIPNTGGTIMNNMNTKNALSGGGGVTVVQHNNFALGVGATARAEVAKLLPQIQESSKAAVLEAAARGGSFRRGLMGG